LVAKADPTKENITKTITIGIEIIK